MKKEDRNIYIGNIDVDKAMKQYYNRLNLKPNYEEISILDSIGRITFEAVHANTSSPNYNAAAMDGIAVRAKDTYGASESTPKVLEESKDFLYVNTGNPVVSPYDAVIMIEDVIELGEGKIQVLSGAYPWQHIRPIGEDIVATEMIVPSKHKIRPMDLGALIAGGVEIIKVYRKPKVGIIPTGSEIVEDISNLQDGKISDSNSRVFEGLITEYGGSPNRYSPVKDDYQLLKDVISKGVEENDILIINAGSSAGTKDFTVKLIKELGKVVIHGVAIKPGKPTILGIIQDKPVIGIPGYPVSAYLVFETFAKPLVYSLTGQREKQEDKVKATITKRVVSSFKNKELVRVNLGLVGNKIVATPLSSGAGVTMSLVKADGIVEIPRSTEGIEVGEEVEVSLLKKISHIKETLVSIGSHDLIMDIVGDMMKLSSGHVGSMGGIMAMKRNECHIAPIHLLDMDTGEYNISYIKKYFSGNKMVLIKGVRRLQGFIVQKNNPMDIKGFIDLKREDISFANRQRGAGTRLLLDYNLKKLEIDPSQITGYERELNTHMAIAMAVKSGSSVTALGIESVAKAMDLDFINVGYEDYDFLLPYEILEDSRVEEFIKTLKSEEFKNRVSSLGGYELDNTGEIVIV